MTESELVSKTSQRWRDLSDEWERGPHSQKEFCKLKSISYAMFSQWRSKLLKEAGLSRAQMKPVAIKAQSLTQASAIHVVLPSGIRLVIANGIHEATLKMILSCLRDSPC